jgi:ribosomal protein L13
MKTFTAKPAEVEREWWVVDAEGQTLGRLATRIATILRGKHKPIYTPHVDTGDFVIIINAEKIQAPGPADHRSGQGNAPQELPGARDAQEAEGLCRPRAPSCCSKAPEA